MSWPVEIIMPTGCRKIDPTAALIEIATSSTDFASTKEFAERL